VKTNQREARAAGDIYYTTGKPCTHGHYGARYTVSGNCVDCKVRRALYTPKKPRNDLMGFSALLTPEWYAAFFGAWEVVSMGSDADRAKLMQALTFSGQGLTAPDAKAAGIYLDSSDTVSGHEDYRDAGEEMHIRIQGKWYSEFDVIDLMQGRIQSIKEIK